IPLLRFQLGHAAIRIVGVAENNRFGGASRFASGHDFAVADGAILLFRFDAPVVDALDAVSALFHHAAAAHGDFGISQEFQLGRIPILEAQEIEAAHFVGAVVGAIARADAAVVDHVVQAFRAMGRCAHRADLLAGRVFALLARHGLEERLRIIERGIVLGGIAGRFAAGSRFGVRIVAVDADPVHFAAAHDLILAHHGNVIFGLAG